MKWFRLYTEIRDDPKMWELTDLQFRIFINLLCLASEQDKNGSVFGHPSAISWSIRCDRRAFDRATKTLIEHNILKEIDGGFEIINWRKRQFISDDINSRVRKYRQKETLHETLHETPPEQNRTDREFSLIENNLIFKDKPKIRKPFQYTDDFNSFWQAYPKQVGKGKAFEEWRKLSGNGIPPLEEILNALKLHTQSTQWTKENGQYIPLPATWLHQRRWDDVPALKDPFKGKVSDKTARSLANMDRWEEHENEKQKEIP